MEGRHVNSRLTQSGSGVQKGPLHGISVVQRAFFAGLFGQGAGDGMMQGFCFNQIKAIKATGAEGLCMDWEQR